MDDSSKSRVDRDTELAKTLGQIRVRTYRAIKTTVSTTHNQTLSSPLTEQLAEKALKGKAISFSTTYVIMMVGGRSLRRRADLSKDFPLLSMFPAKQPI